VIVTPREKPLRRNETRELTRPIEIALNKLPGVRVSRNNNLGPVVPWEKRHEPNARAVVAGLGTGSADLVGIVRCTFETIVVVGRVFCLEAKWPGKKPTEDQLVWLDVVRRFGGFACVVHSVDEAIAAVERCRRGEST
jgi:hypothetical protein